MAAYRYVIGCDPGINEKTPGGMVIIDRVEGQVVKMPMPRLNKRTDFVRVWEFLAQCDNDKALFVIEWVYIRANDGIHKAVKLQELVKNSEACISIAALQNMDYAQVHPLTWQSGIHLNTKGLSDTARKKKYKEYASKELGHKFTNPTGDAACIAAWACQMLNQSNSKLLDKIIYATPTC